jgi:apolipoprotein N-acyltransferase
VSGRARFVLERSLLVLLGAALEVLSAPPGPAPVLVFVRDAPFLLLLWHRGGRGWAPWAWIYGFVLFVAGLRWLAHVHWTMALSAPFVLAFTYLAWAAAVRSAARRRLPFPLVVGATAVLQEILQTVVQGASGMPWPARPLAFAAWPALTGAAALLGAYGLSFLAGLTSAVASGLPSLLRRDPYRSARLRAEVLSVLGALGTVGLAWLLGSWQVAYVQGRMSGPNPEAARTASLVVVQANVAQSLKNERTDPRSVQQIFDAHLRLTREALETLKDGRREALAVLWPETMILWPFLDPVLAPRFPEAWANQHVILQTLRDVVPEGMSTRFLVGVTRHLEGRTGRHEFLEDHDVTDSVLYADPALVPEEVPIPPADALALRDWRPPWELGWHHKVVLVPWGEYAPGASWLPFLRTVRDQLSVIPEITPGATDQTPFLLTIAPPVHPGGPNRPVSAGTIVCFEIAFPARCRAWRRAGATVLLNPGNYAWYGDSEMPAQLEALGRLRAAELAVTVVIAGNTGPTCIVDPSGTVRERVRVGGRTQYVEGWCAGPLWGDPAYRTLYTRVGDVPWWALGVLLLVAGLLRSRHGFVTRDAPRAPAPASPGVPTPPRSDSTTPSHPEG